jgi:Fe2+ or Zn2+ uptake regulation protein
MAPPDVSDELRLAGLRVTAPRQSVLQWLVEHPHATAEQIRAGVAEQLGSVSTQAIYDVLAACARPCQVAAAVDDRSSSVNDPPPSR